MGICRITRTVREFVEEVNRYAGDGTMALVYSFWGGGLEIRCRNLEISLARYGETQPMTPAEQSSILEAVGLEMLIPTMGLDVPASSD